MPGKSKKGGGLEVGSAYKMKNSVLHASAKYGSPMQANYGSPIKKDKVKQFEAKESEMETLKKTKKFTRKEATKIAKESTVLPEIEIKAKKPEKRYTKKDLANANREQKGAIMYHAKKNKYEIK